MRQCANSTTHQTATECPLEWPQSWCTRTVLILFAFYFGYLTLPLPVGACSDRLQEDFAKEKEKRLVERARMAPILSLGF